jgi:iron complex outermembrane receptor protein
MSYASASAQTTPAADRDTKATSGVEEVVVTAERRSTNLQTTAIAATVLNQADLDKKGIVTIDQLQFVSPSLTVNNFGQGNNVDIRGIGKSQTNSQTQTGVVTYRDGVASFPGYFQEEPYYDVADVEVLRGPQGTFSGQNATGGAILVNTQNPEIGGGYDGYISAHYGNYNDTGLQGAVNLPIDDTLAARVAFNGQYREPFSNIHGGTGDSNLYWASGRISLLWTPTNSIDVLFKTDYNYLDNGGYFGQATIDPLTGKVSSTDKIYNYYANNFPIYATDQFVRSTLKIDYKDPSSGITFRSVSGYQQGRSGWKGSLDGTPLPTAGITIAESALERIFSEELNVISPDDRPLTWIAGAYYQRNTFHFPGNGGFDIGAPPGVIDEQLYGTNPSTTEALFGQVSLDLPDGFQIQGGLRYTDWKNTSHITFLVPELAAFGFVFPQNATVKGQNLTGKLTLNWNVNDDNFLYAFVATGAKPGGQNTALYFDGGLIPPPFRQEYVTDYEVGWKSRLLDDHLHTQVGAYYNNFDHFQVTVPIPNDPTQNTELNNPNPTKLYGFEASAQAVFGDLSIDTNVAWEHSSLGKFYTEDNRVATSAVPCDPNTGPASPVCINLQGNPQTYAPDFTFNADAQYDFHIDGSDLITPAVTYSYISHQWATIFDNKAAGDYLAPRSILGASLAWTHGDTVVKLYGYNLTNDKYVSALITPLRLPGAPRQYGISIMKAF